MGVKAFMKKRASIQKLFKTYFALYSWALLFVLNVILLSIFIYERTNFSGDSIVFVAIINFVLVFLAAYNCLVQIQRIKK